MKKFCANLLIILLFFLHIFVVYPVEAKMLSKNIFAQRRQKLLDKMDGGIAVFSNTTLDRDFYYLTGFEEPQAAFLLIPDAEEKFIMFVRPQNPARERWIGKRHGVEGAVEIFGADKAFPIDRFEKILPQYLRGKDKVYFSLKNKELAEKLIKIINRRWGNWPKQIIDPLQYIHEMRLVKSPEEIELMRKAIDITCDAFIEAMKAAEPGMHEYEIEAIIEYIFRKNGSPGPGFPSIVGSGPNSTILHYEVNNRQTQDGDLIVMDIGAEYGYYSADITRTIPVNGKFSKEQREIYEIVLEAQQSGVETVAPGTGIYGTHYHILKIIKDGLYRLGLITDKNSKWQHLVWLMYNTCHWLGLDVHDVGGRGRDDGKGREFKPGMVLAVEPGIYIGENSLDNLSKKLEHFKLKEEEIAAFVSKVKPVAQKYINIGVRIEDDILVTENGHENLSSEVPKKIDEIEKLMKEKSYLNRN